MNKSKRFLASLAALLLFSGVAMTAPVAARDGGRGSSDVSSSSDVATAADDNTTSDSSTSGSTLVEQFREQAKEKIRAARLKGETQSQTHRQQACTARKAALTKRMSNAVRNADNLKGVMDRMFTKLQTFYTNKNLNVADYAALKSAVETAQTNAQTSINALSTLNVNVDCSSQTVADSVSAFQTAVGNTRDSLKAYRKTLVDLINSLKGASTGAHSTTDSADNSTDTTNQ
jgi:hypothetical protein